MRESDCEILIMEFSLASCLSSVLDFIHSAHLLLLKERRSMFAFKARDRVSETERHRAQLYLCVPAF